MRKRMIAVFKLEISIAEEFKAAPVGTGASNSIILAVITATPSALLVIGTVT